MIAQNENPKSFDKEKRKLALEYASLAVERLKNANRSDQRSKNGFELIDKRMIEIRSQLGLEHAQILSIAISCVN